MSRQLDIPSIELTLEVNRAFSVGVFEFFQSWGAAPGFDMNAAPLALNT